MSSDDSLFNDVQPDIVVNNPKSEFRDQDEENRAFVGVTTTAGTPGAITANLMESYVNKKGVVMSPCCINILHKHSFCTDITEEMLYQINDVPLSPEKSSELSSTFTYTSVKEGISKINNVLQQAKNVKAFSPWDYRYAVLTREKFFWKKIVYSKDSQNIIDVRMIRGFEAFDGALDYNSKAKTSDIYENLFAVYIKDRATLEQEFALAAGAEIDENGNICVDSEVSQKIDANTANIDVSTSEKSRKILAPQQKRKNGPLTYIFSCTTKEDRDKWINAFMALPGAINFTTEAVMKTIDITNLGMHMISNPLSTMANQQKQGQIEIGTSFNRLEEESSDNYGENNAAENALVAALGDELGEQAGTDSKDWADKVKKERIDDQKREKKAIKQATMSLVTAHVDPYNDKFTDEEYNALPMLLCRKMRELDAPALSKWIKNARDKNSAHFNSNVRTKAGFPLIHVALHSEPVDKFEVLLKDAKCDPDILDENGFPPLFYCVEQESKLEYAEALAKNGADMQIHSLKGKSVLHHAIDFVCESGVKFLIDHGCPITIVDSSKMKAEKLAEQGGFKSIIDIIKAGKKKQKKL